MRYVQLFVLFIIAAGLFAACGISIEEGVPYMIYSKNERLCFDVVNWQKDEGAQIILWDASDPSRAQANQVWFFRKVDDGYKIFSKHSNLCIDVADESSSNGAFIIQSNDRGDDAYSQIWQIEKSNGGYLLIALHSGKLLSTREGGIFRTVRLAQYGFEDIWKDAQTWIIKKLEE